MRSRIVELSKSSKGKIKHSSLAALANFINSNKYFGVDTETSQLSMIGQKVLLIQIGNAESQFVIEVGRSDISSIVSFLNHHLFERLDKVKIYHNAKFDIQALWTLGINNALGSVYDTMLAECVLNAGKDTEKGFYSLYGVCLRYLNQVLDKSVRGDINRFGVTDRVIRYGAKDVEYLPQIRELQLKKITQLGLNECLELENQAVFPIAYMETCGIDINLDDWSKVSEEVDGLLTEVHAQLNHYVLNSELLQDFTFIHQDLFTSAERRVDINWSSPAQKLKLLRRIFPNIPDTNKNTLKKRDYEHPVTKLMMQAGSISTLKKSFTQKMPKLVHPESNRLYTDFWQIVSTGRMSSRTPNLQNIPAQTELGRKMRGCFVASDGFDLVGGDYSQCELRVIAHYSRDPLWVKVFESGGDLHSTIASEVFNIDPGMVRKPSPMSGIPYRNIAKTFNFGLAYGMSQYKLSSELQISVQAAEEIIYNYFRKVPKVKAFLTELGELGKKNGYIRTGDKYRRIRWFEGFDNKDDFKRQGSIEREAKNLPIQGANANIIKKALIDTYKKIIENNYPVRMLLTVHDEIITECPKEFSHDWQPILQDTMVAAGQEIIESIPVKVDVSIGKNWLQVH